MFAEFIGKVGPDSLQGPSAAGLQWSLAREGASDDAISWQVSPNKVPSNWRGAMERVAPVVAVAELLSLLPVWGFISFSLLTLFIPSSLALARCSPVLS